jgi:hypothetical protein
MSQQQNDIQERIAAARREAEQLKEKIRAKRESSADTSRKIYVVSSCPPFKRMATQCAPWLPK